MNLSDVDIRLLRVFRTVAETGGFSQAAVMLNVGTSTISTHMADLERRLGFRLCDRGRSGFALTQKGERTLELSSSLSSALDDFTAAVGNLEGKITGKLHIGLIDYMTSVPGFRIADVMHKFSQSAPEATLNLQVLPKSDLISAIVDARIHIGIGPNRVANVALQFEPFLDEVLQLYCGARHPFYDRDLNDETYQSVHSQKFVGNRLEGSANDTRRWSVAGDAYGSNLEIIAILILSGEYLGFLPTHFARHWIDTGEMQTVRSDLFSVPQDLPIVTRHAGRRTAPLVEFMRLLKDECGSSL